MREKKRAQLPQWLSEGEIEVDAAEDLMHTLEFQRRLIRYELNAYVVHTRKLEDCAGDWSGRS